MPARSAPVVMGNWKDGLKNFIQDADTRRFVDAVYEMPLDFVAAFESDRDTIANALIAGGQVRGMETAISVRDGSDRQVGVDGAA